MIAGRYRWHTVTDQWSWSAGVYLLHGYPARSVQLSTALVLQHKAEEDRAHAAALLLRCRTRPASFSHYHHLRDSYGRMRSVLAVGDSYRDGDGHLVTVGYFADLTEAARTIADAAVAAATESQRVVHQAQGALMVAHGLSGPAAHGLIAEYARRHQISLATVAERLLAVLVQSDPPGSGSGTTHRLDAELARHRTTAGPAHLQQEGS